jgi:hypothetical protein
MISCIEEDENCLKRFSPLMKHRFISVEQFSMQNCRMWGGNPHDVIEHVND